ncbi:MAG: transposase [Burkholderiaceae bacterium]
MWVEKIQRINGKFSFMSVDENGRRSDNAISELSRVDCGLKLDRAKVLTNFSEWTVASAKSYLPALTDNYEELHRVFSFQNQGIQFLVPALVLLKAFFRPNEAVFKYLFEHNGLERICVPSTSTQSDVAILLPLCMHSRAAASLSIRQPLSWMWSFPSAKNLWDSVILAANRGELSLDLPIGLAKVVLHGQKSGNLFKVTDVHFTKITTTEESYEFAVGHTKAIQFHKKIKHPRKRALRTDIPTHADGSITLTDEEWLKVSILLDANSANKSKNRKYPLRSIVDGIVNKNAHGIAWKDANFKEGNLSSALQYFRKWNKDGRWEELVSYLNTARKL